MTKPAQFRVKINTHSEIIPAAAGAEKDATNVSKFKIIDGDPATDDIIASAGHHVIDAGRRTRHVVFALEGVKLSSLQADDVLFV